MATIKRLKVYCDGGARGNPGPAAAGVVIYNENKKIGEYSKFLGHNTNNYAEYSAVELALEALDNLDYKKADFYLDSELVVKQLNGIYKVKHANLRPIFERITAHIDQTQTTFAHIPRAQNKEADAQVNICLDRQSNK